MPFGTPAFLALCLHSTTFHHVPTLVDTVLGARDPAANKTDKVPGLGTKAATGSFIILSSWVFPLHSLSVKLFDVKSVKFPT
jgi:hypothetical protein